MKQFAWDFLTAPVEILADIGHGAISVGRKTVDTTFSLANALPWLVGPGLVVIGIGLYQGSVRYEKRA